MKRFPAVLLGAIAGAIGLPILMVAFRAAGWALFARMSAPPISIVSNPFRTYQPFIKSNSDPRVFIVGALLAVLSVELWRGERTFWPRFKSALGAASVFMYFVWNVAANYRDWSLATSITANSTATAIYYLPTAASHLPPILWALALLFFAILARKRKPLLP